MSVILLPSFRQCEKTSEEKVIQNALEGTRGNKEDCKLYVHDQIAVTEGIQDLIKSN